MKFLLLSILFAFIACAGVEKVRDVASEDSKKSEKEQKKKQSDSQQYRGNDWDTPMERF